MSRRRRLAEARRLRGLRKDMARVCMPPPRKAWGAFGKSLMISPARVTSPECIHVGDDVVIHEETWLSVVRHFDGIVPRLVIEDGVRIGRGCQFSVVGEVVVARGAIIGDFVQIGDTYHPFETEQRMAELAEPSPVRIGEGAVIGGHATIAPGVTVGAGAYVDHHSVVGRDVPAGTVVAGNPARARV